MTSTFFTKAVKIYLLADGNSPVRLSAINGTILEIFQMYPVFAQNVLDLLEKYIQQFPIQPRVKELGLAIAVAHKFLTIPLPALQSFDSSVQPAIPTTSDKARNIRKTLSTRWVESDCISRGFTKFTVDPSYLPTEAFLIDLLELLDNSRA